MTVVESLSSRSYPQTLWLPLSCPARNRPFRCAPPKSVDMDEFTSRRLRSVVSILIEQRDIVLSKGDSLAARLIDLAIIQLRLTLQEISEEELSEFSDVLSTVVIKQDQAD